MSGNAHGLVRCAFASKSRNVCRLALLLAGIAASLMLLSGCDRPTDGVDVRPNILILYLDDFGFNDIGAFGSTEVDTPNLDRFASEAVRFTRHYADSTCSASRAALLTGQFPARLGYSPDGPGISPQTPTLPRALKEVGYRNFHVGKWHLGHTSRAAWPDAVGFDEWFGFLSQWLMQGPYSLPHSDEVFASPTYFDPWLDGSHRDPQQYQGHLSDILGAYTIDLIQGNRLADGPWLINHWFYLPHTPIQPADRFASTYEDSDRGRSLAMLAQADEMIGQILDALERSGQAHNTIVVIAGDNGGANIHRNNNLPYHGKKAEFNEGGLRTPLMVRWLGEWPESHTVDSVVSITDLMPTLLRAVGHQVPMGVDGHDLSELVLEGKPMPPRELVWENRYYEHYGFGVLSSDGEWRLSSSFANWPHERGAVLMNLGRDPSGAENVAIKHEGKVAELTGSYREWFIPAHSLKLDHGPLELEGIAVTGDDLQRTPGHGAFTFAIGLHLPKGSQTSEAVLVEQSEVWSVTLDSPSRRIDVRLGDYGIDARVSASEGCQSLVFAAVFHRRLNNWENNESNMRLRLFVNGVLQSEKSFLGALDVGGAHSEPTYIGVNPEGRQKFQGRLGEPLFFNAAASETNYLNPAMLHERVCDQLTRSR